MNNLVVRDEYSAKKSFDYEDDSMSLTYLRCGIATLSEKIVEVSNTINKLIESSRLDSIDKNKSYINKLEEKLFDLETLRKNKICKLNDLLTLVEKVC